MGNLSLLAVLPLLWSGADLVDAPRRFFGAA